MLLGISLTLRNRLVRTRMPGGVRGRGLAAPFYSIARKEALSNPVPGFGKRREWVVTHSFWRLFSTFRLFLFVKPGHNYGKIVTKVTEAGFPWLRIVVRNTRRGKEMTTNKLEVANCAGCGKMYRPEGLA